MGIIIRRESLERFLDAGGRLLVYGRRKTGKTFYTRYKLRDYDYFIVRKGGLFYDPESQAEYGVREFIQLCKRTSKIVVDEFHRASGEFYSAIQAGECPDNMVLVTSTLHYYKRFIEPGDAPLKGLFLSHKVGLISPVDLVRHPWTRNTSQLYERLVYYQEPVLIGRGLREIMLYSGDMARSLTGEVLAEEDYEATLRFHHILEAVSMGKTRVSEISSYLYSRGLIPGQSPSYITKYLDTMVRTGLIEKIPVWRKRKALYRHVSPLTHTAYYLDARYGAWEYPVPEDFILRAGRSIIPVLMEVFVERLISQDCGLQPVKILNPEIDVALTKYRKLWLAVEVKWKNNLERKELREAEDKLSRVNAPIKIMVTKHEASSTASIPMITLGELANLIKQNPHCKWVEILPLPSHL